MGVKPVTKAENLHVSIEETSKELKNLWQKGMKKFISITAGRRDHECKKVESGSGLRLGPHEGLKSIVQDGLIAQREKIRNNNVSNLTRPYDEHLTTLIRQTRISYRNEKISVNQFFDKIRRAFEEINDVSEELASILKIVSTSRSLMIIFDFNYSTISHFDPTKGNHVKATTYFEKSLIIIASLDMFSAENYLDLLGTLAHELTHFAMQLLYENECRPYLVDEDSRRGKYDKILTYCERKLGKEELIDRVFMYSRFNQSAELIARVPQILTSYKDDKDRINLIKSTFHDLFEFYENETFFDLKNAIPVLEASKLISDMNSSSATFNEFSKHEAQLRLEAGSLNYIKNEPCHYVTNCPILTMQAIKRKLQMLTKRSLAVFINEGDLRVTRIVETICKAKKLHADIRIVFDCSSIESEENFEESIKTMRENGFQDSLILVTREDFFNSIKSCALNRIEIFHRFSELTEESKEKIMKKIINFHEEKIAIEKLFDEKEVENFQNFPLNGLLIGKKVFIKNDVTNDGFQIKREFFALTIDCQEKEVTIDEILQYKRDKQVRLISGFAGAGKSEAMKAIAIKLKQKHQTYWILLLDMKSVVGKLSTETSFDNRDEIWKFLEEFIDDEQKFSAEISKHLFEKNRMIILIDGIDEISRTYEKTVLNLVSSIEIMSNIQIWIATRPRFANKLMQFSNFVRFTLKPFEIEDCLNYVSIIDGSEQIENSKLKLENVIQTLSLTGTLSPLLVRFICEIVEEDSFNLNSFTLFKKITVKMIDFCLLKNVEANNLLRCVLVADLSLVKVLEIIAISSLFKEIWLTGFSNEKEIFEQNKKVFSEFLLHLGLVSFERLEKELTFNDPIFAEYFIAKLIHEKFFVNNFYLLDNQNSILQLVLRCLKPNSIHPNITTFVNSSLESFNMNSRTLEIREEYSRQGYLKVLRSEMEIHKMVENHLVNLISYLTFGSRQDNLKFWSRPDENRKNIMITAANHLSSEEFETLFELALNMFGTEYLLELLDEESKEEIVSISEKRGVNEITDCVIHFLAEVSKLLIDENLIREEKCFEAAEEQSVNDIFTRKFEEKEILEPKNQISGQKSKQLIKIHVQGSKHQEFFFNQLKPRTKVNLEHSRIENVNDNNLFHALSGHMVFQQIATAFRKVIILVTALFSLVRNLYACNGEKSFRRRTVVYKSKLFNRKLRKRSDF